MRILKVSDVCFPRVNGVSTSIQTFRDGLHQLGHQTLLVAPAYPAQAPDREPGILRIPSRAVPRDPEDRVMHYRNLVGCLRKLVKDGSFDVVHVHTPFLAHYAALRATRGFGVPVVETCHTHFEEYLHHYVPFAPRAVMRSIARRFTVAQCNAVDAIVVPSQSMLEVLRRYGVQARAEVIPTGLDLARFRGGDGARFRHDHRIAPDRPMLVHISRVAFEKNIDFIVRCFARIHAVRPDALLLIAGEGPAEGRLRSQVARLGLGDSVRFTGYLDRGGALLDCYRAADVFVFASRTETQGLVLLEAMALGVPVVSTAVLGTADVLRDAEGAIVVAEDEERFAATVVALLGDPAARARLATGGPVTAARWSAAVQAARLAELYASV